MHPALRSVRGLAFEGGGILGLGYLGPVERLDREGALRQVERFAGASAGAITAALLACGATPQRLAALWQATDFERIFGGRWSVVRLIRTGGLRSLDRPREWIRRTFAGLGVDPDMPLCDMRRHGCRSLVVTVTCESERADRALDERCGVAIGDAVLASMAIPLYYEAVEFGGKRYSDGGLANNLPVVTLELPPAECLAFRLDSEAELTGVPPRHSPGPIGRIVSLIDTVRRAANGRHVPEEFWPRIVRIPTGRLSATDWSIAKRREGAGLQRAGQMAFEAWLSRAPSTEAA